MSDWMEILRIVLKVVFWGILPAVIFYYRYKKKFTTGFSIGAVITCLIFGVLSIATVKEDPVTKFMTAVNTKNYEESKKSYKVLIQYGPEYLKKIQRNEIIDLEFHEKLKKDIISEYHGIADRYNRTVAVKKITTCDKYVEEMRKFQKLKHAIVLLNYAGHIGGVFSDLETSLQEKISAAEPVVAENKKLCD